MFDLNTKIVLLASSYHKQTGPRKNSIGYITPFNNSLTVLKNSNVVTSLAVIRFLRYGNEKRARFETGKVLLVFPIFQNVCNIDNQLEKFIHTINSNKYAEHWDKIRDHMKVNRNFPIVLPIPVSTPKVNFKLCSSQEFFCWFESFLMAPQINAFVNKALTTRHFFQNDHFTIQNLLTLQNMMIDKSMRHGIMNGVYKNLSKRNKWINIIRIITIISELNAQGKSMDNLFYTATRIKHVREDIPINDIYSALVCYIFCHSFPKFRNIIINSAKRNVKSKEVCKIVNRIESTKDAIFELAAKYLD